MNKICEEAIVGIADGIKYTFVPSAVVTLSSFMAVGLAVETGSAPNEVFEYGMVAGVLAVPVGAGIGAVKGAITGWAENLHHTAQRLRRNREREFSREGQISLGEG